ncbi:MAG: ABC transporter permease, partial [Gemmatimonadetes bacterium]|nr:ABC transporter permease [Gemmatimonadota bacterium]
MGALLKDLRFGARALGKKPGSSALSIIAFALGIGLTTTMFSLVYGVFLRGLGVPEADRLLMVFENNPSENRNQMSVSQHDFFDWRDTQESFEGLAYFSSGTVNLSGTEGPERFDGAFVSAKVFDLLRVRPIVGSTFREGDDLAGAPLTVVLGHAVWETRYDSDSGVVGQVVKVNGEQATILGVMPKGFQFPQDQELWVVRRDQRAQNSKRGTGPSMRVFGRLKDGVTVEKAELEFAMIAQRLAQEYPESNQGVGTVFVTFVENDTGPQLKAVFGAMQVATIFVLLIACANVANLLLARAAMRTKEAALRSALGASRLRVMMPVFSEAVMLSLAGAVIGIGIAYLGVWLFDGATADVGKPYYMEFAVDVPILVFVVAVTALTAVFAGAAPALQISKTDVNSILKDEARGSSSFHGGKLSKVLVVGEIALSCALLVGAGLMTKSIVQLRNYQFDFATEDVFTARVGLFESDYPDRQARARFYRDLVQRLEAIPGAQSVALTNALPALGSGGRAFAIQGGTYETDQDYPTARTASITPNFFRTFDVDIRSGRDFTLQDDADAPGVVIVNQRFAERFFEGQDPIGRRVREGRADSEAEWKTIVGIAPNLGMEGLGNNETDPAGYYTPVDQGDIRFMSLAVRTRGGAPLTITPDVRRAVRTVDTDLPIYNVFSMVERIKRGTWFYNVFGTLFIIFGAAALFMASVGLYGVLSFSVSRRTQEMGIRMALGANAGNVIRLVLRQGLMQLGVGLIIGLGLAFGLSSIVAVIMFDVQPRDLTVFGSVVGVITLVGLLASFIP